ncbi:MAG: hypothetical protein ABSA23_16215 [Anaerolineales bacterium]|jgi:hypothetical protein
MKFKLPKKNTFWAAVIIAAVGVVVYIVHLSSYLPHIRYIPLLQPVAFLLVVVAFLLLCMGLTLKDF